MAWAAKRLRQYMLNHTTWLISKMDPIKYIFEKPALTGRIARWQMLLSKYDIEYRSQKATKGSILADHLSHQPIEDYQSVQYNFPDEEILYLKMTDYDEQYDMIGEIEAQIDELQNQIRSIRQEKISGDNIYQLLLAFDEVYNSATEAEQKEFMKAFIERIDMFPEKRKDGCWIKNIVFNIDIRAKG